jgi:anaerobic ribonucleoside-triphosphate reductase activating protein
MYYSKIRQLDIANGPGCRVSIFVSGCEHHCQGCFNPETWSFSHGQIFSDETIEALFAYAEPAHVSGLSILGGEPLHPKNRDEVLNLVRKFKEKYPEKSVWLWTGYLWEDVAEYIIDSGVDVVVDGKFVEELKDFRLKYCGSTNQRVIDVWKSSKVPFVIS